MSERVLVVDDEREIVESCTCVLRRLGYEPKGCDTAQAALDALAEDPHDLVITDVMMPDMTGLQLLAAAKPRYPGLNVIIITGCGTMGTAIEAIRSGASDFIGKPFGVPDLRTAVGRVSGRARGLRMRLQARADVEQESLRTERMAMLDQLGACVAHGLRNPLEVANNSVCCLKDRLGQQDAKVTRCLGIISDEIETRKRIITNLAESSQVQAIAAKLIDPNALVGQVIERTNLPPGITLHTGLAPDLPCVQADVGKMCQVFVNLVTNAIEAMPQGGCLDISTHQQDGWVEFNFCDTGSGIAPEILPRIFEPLFTTKPNGMGLGLSLAQAFVEAHHGQCAVSSHVGQGSCFTIRLPHQGQSQ